MGSISSTTILKPLSVVKDYISISFDVNLLRDPFLENRMENKEWFKASVSYWEVFLVLFLERLINPRTKMLPTVECWEDTVLCMARMCGTVKDFCKPIWELPASASLYWVSALRYFSWYD